MSATTADVSTETIQRLLDERRQSQEALLEHLKCIEDRADWLRSQLGLPKLIRPMSVDDVPGALSEARRKLRHIVMEIFHTPGVKMPFGDLADEVIAKGFSSSAKDPKNPIWQCAHRLRKKGVLRFKDDMWERVK